MRSDLPRSAPSRPRVSAGVQLGVSLVSGIAVAVSLGSFTAWGLVPVFAWDLSCLVYLTWVWLSVWRLDAEGTARLAVPVDPTRAVADALIVLAAVASLVAVGFVLGRAATSSGMTQVALAGLGVASVALSWGVVHTVYTLRYARLYYTGPDGGVDFNDDQPPRYSDFAYLAFTLGMTFQVSDTDLQSNEFRRTALTQSLLSFLFATGIVATTVNLVSNLSH